MSGKCTIKEVALHAGVSVATVSRVLNKHASVAPDLAEKVQTAITVLGYRPNVHARSIRNTQNIRSSAPKSIGIIIPSAGNLFFSQLLEGVLAGADRAGLQVTVYSNHGDDACEAQIIELAASSGIQGLLYCPSSYNHTAQVRSSFPSDFPLVVLYRREVIPGAPHIYHDNIQGGYLAARHLLLQGHRNIVFFFGRWEHTFSTVSDVLSALESPSCGCYSSLDRLSGHCKALQEFGISFDPGLVHMTGYDFESGYRSLKEFLSLLRDFDAIICSNDSVAAGVLQALRECNISVPEQVSVMGYDNSVFSTIVRPQLTTIHQDPEALGSGAVDALVRRMAHDQVSDTAVPVHLVIRNSTAMK